MIIDANVLYGFENNSNLELSIERVLSIMDACKIDKGIICNQKCKYYDFMEGNKETWSLVEKYPDRFWGFASFHQSQFLNVEEDVERSIKEYGLSGIRFYNTMSGFMSGWGGGVNSLFMQRIYRKLEKWRVPVFIEGGFPFDVIASIAQKYPGLPIIASGIGYGNMSEGICAAQDNRNIYLEISTLDTMDGIKILTEYVSDEQLIFGTGIPYNSPSSEKLMVETADISKKSKENIFYRNILRLIGKEEAQHAG